MHTGGCLCGAVRYTVDGTLAPIEVCHCSQCRKAQGSAFAANIPLRRADVKFIQGEDKLSEYRATPLKRRVFCRTCGSPLFSQRDDTPEVIRLRAGTLDEPVAAAIGFHFMVGSKASWWTIADGLPQHVERP